MVKAYVLIEMVAGHSQNLIRDLSRKNVASDLHRVTGPYDVIAVVNGDDLSAISDLVTSEIHTQPGVVRTTTCVCLE